MLTKAHDAFTGIWSLAHIKQVNDYLAKKSPTTKLVIGGWGGGPQLPPVLRGLDRELPNNIVFSCLNPGTGHVPELNDIAKRRPVWSFPWLEFDGWLWHLQLRAGSMLDQVKAAEAAHLAGVVAIHWRTEEVRANMEAFAAAANNPATAPSTQEYYRQYCSKYYGQASVVGYFTLLLNFENEKRLGYVSSPEFYPYDPSWGRVSKQLADEVKEVAIRLLDQLQLGTASREQKSNLQWLQDNFKCTLLLDRSGAAVRRRAAADLPRARLPEGRSDPHPRRADELHRRQDRGVDPVRARPPDGRTDDVHDRSPPVDARALLDTPPRVRSDGIRRPGRHRWRASPGDDRPRNRIPGPGVPRLARVRHGSALTPCQARARCIGAVISTKRSDSSRSASPSAGARVGD